MRPASLFLIILFCVFGTVAQSGRKQKEKPSPAIVPVPAATPATKDEQPTSSAKISSLIVSGEIIDDATYSNSNYMDIVLKELTTWLKYEPRPFFNVTKGGTMTFDGAKDRAKRETDSHLLWLGIVSRIDSRGQATVTHIDYSILMPTTANVLLSGRIIPGKQSIVGQGGVMTIPSMSKRSSEIAQMRQGARQLAERLKNTGWF